MIITIEKTSESSQPLYTGQVLCPKCGLLWGRFTVWIYTRIKL